MSNVGSLALRGCAIAATPSMLKANVRNVCFVIDFKFYVRVKNIRIGLHCQNYKVFTAPQILGRQKNKQRIPTGFSTFFCNFVYLQKPIKYITMKRLVILFALFFAGISAFAYGEESIGQKTNTEAGRYEIIIPDNMIRYTFRLDKFTGDIWQLVKNSDDSSTWQKVYREPSYFDSTDEDKINYQLIVPANAARFIMLININNGTTWQICRTKDDEVAFQLVY